ncbi:MAG: hypothetical protein J07HN6_01083 [Halonotius sp. J07HN6]|nr:MAG: hypothetical protein J07HN6_01083 [Halonotius sp. J07HN6]
MRDIPPANPSGDRGRPLVALLIGLLICGGAVVAVQSGVSTAIGELSGGSELTVTVTATPVNTTGSSPRTLDSFRIATPVHRAVSRALDANQTARVQATAESPSTVGLGADSKSPAFVVVRDSRIDTPMRHVRVTATRR